MKKIIKHYVEGTLQLFLQKFSGNFIFKLLNKIKTKQKRNTNTKTQMTTKPKKTKQNTDEFYVEKVRKYEFTTVENTN